MLCTYKLPQVVVGELLTSRHCWARGQGWVCTTARGEAALLRSIVSPFTSTTRPLKPQVVRSLWALNRFIPVYLRPTRSSPPLINILNKTTRHHLIENRWNPITNIPSLSSLQGLRHLYTIELSVDPHRIHLYFSFFITVITQ